jgi:hypothetical protein
MVVLESVVLFMSLQIYVTRGSFVLHTSQGGAVGWRISPSVFAVHSAHDPLRVDSAISPGPKHRTTFLVDGDIRGCRCTPVLLVHVPHVHAAGCDWCRCRDNTQLHHVVCHVARPCGECVMSCALC